MNKSNNGAAKRRWIIGGLAVAALAAVLWAAYRPRPLDVETARVAEGRSTRKTALLPIAAPSSSPASTVKLRWSRGLPWPCSLKARLLKSQIGDSH